ncbi:hypothetical protein JCM10207_003406 [Rhodosporidiobolus poonsookiae]
MSFGPGSAFSFAAPTRPPRRVNSSGSFKDAVATPNSASSPLSGPSPVDPPAAPSLGSFAADGLTTNGINGTSLPNGQHHGTDGSSRSFSSILSPSLAATLNGGTLDGLADGVNGAGKPFVYSREFLLSLYDEEKAKKRPIELAAHEVATRELGGDSDGTHKPWLLQDYREGEKELFATSIHPANIRPPRASRTDSTHSAGGANGSSATLDLSTLGTLPRDRDRALGSPSMRSPSVEKDGILGSAGRERRTRERSAGGTMGILGGVLGGIANQTPTRKREDSGSNGAKEVWQGGRWRRGAQQEAEEAEKTQRTSAFGSRRFPLAEDNDGRPASPGAGDVPDSWDDSEPAAHGKSSALNGDALPSEPELTASVLGSLALDADLGEDPLLAKPASGTQTPARGGPPPGLGNAAPVNPVDVQWQYRDPSGTVQGPFTATMMHDWYRQQFFTPDLRVKRTTDLDYESLENLIRRTGDSEKPFLAPKPVAPTSAFSSAPGTPQNASWSGTPRAQTPLEQLAAAVGQGRFGAAPAQAGNSFYEPFGSAAASPAPQSQGLPQAFGAASSVAHAPSTQGPGALDPWGAPLPSNAAQGWNAIPQQQQPQQPAFPHQQSPADLLLRQLAQQQQAQQQQFAPGGVPTDFLGRPVPHPASPFFDPSQLISGAGAAASPTAWLNQQLPQQAAALLQQQQLGQPWNALGSPAAAPAAVGSPVVQLQQAPAQSAIPTPIGPPSAVQSTQQSPVQQQAAASPWDAVQPAQPVVEVKETIVVAEPEVPAAPAAGAVVEEVKVEVPAPAAPLKEKAAKKAKAAAAVESKPAPDPVVEKAASPVVEAPAPSVSPSGASKPAAAPWAKEEAAAAAAPTPSPSLREIQEAEAREADKRKQAARIQAAQANIQAAQRAAALEAQAAAESLPSSASWAAGPAQVPPVKGGAAASSAGASSTAAPWSKPAAAPTTKPAGKTLKEIQEEEEKRKKAQVAAQQQQQAAVGQTGRGYAAASASAQPSATSPWTTVAVKPAVVRAAPVAKPLIPGLPTTATTATAVRAAGATGLPVKPVPAPVAAARPAAPTAPAAKVTIVPRSVNLGASAPATTLYDMENPPPPSPEFMAWTRQALKGLTVPMDEFIQMLLSFPLDASADVLEIISDSVYANSSTLDGRRFANDFATRRKNDVAVRYPSIFAKGAVRTAAKPTSMASVLAAGQNQPKTSEWNVKVSAKKKKGGK